MTTKIAVLSDIHGNADSLRHAINLIEQNNVDLTVCLGDLLTYGTQPNEVISLLLDFKQKHELIMVKGNHDQFYIDIFNKCYKPYSMPDFVRESIEWTSKRVHLEDFSTLFDWKQSFQYENIFFAHANPFEYGNWSYLEKKKEIDYAFREITKLSCAIGVFGHSHRQKIILPDALDSKIVGNDLVVISKNEQAIINCGSIGQPRGTGYCYALLSLSLERVTAELVSFKPDIENLICELNMTGMSIETITKLHGYLRG